jgi:branched-chain amino acid transport system substrate-binding protein
VPFGYAAGQILAQAVEATKSLDQNTLADYMHTHNFPTVAGDIAFAKDGEWAKPRIVFTQFQNVSPNDVEQFADGNKQPILWPPQYKTGAMIYPYGEARKK